MWNHLGNKLIFTLPLQVWVVPIAIDNIMFNYWLVRLIGLGMWTLKSRPMNRSIYIYMLYVSMHALIVCVHIILSLTDMTHILLLYYIYLY